MAGFTEKVLAQLRHATGREKEALRAELEAHLMDHATDLVGPGVSWKEAQVRAEEAMGDPEEIGKALDAQFSPLWLWLGRGIGVGIAVLCLALLSASPLNRLYYAQRNWQARTQPESLLSADKLQEDWQVSHPELRAQVGTDEVYIYRVELEPKSGQVRIFVTNYDQNIFGYATSYLVHGLRVTVGGEPWTSSGGGGGADYARSYVTLKGTVPPGTDHVTVGYDQFGNHVSLDVPLDWGEGT